MYPQAMLRKVEDALKLIASSNNNRTTSTSSVSSTKTSTGADEKNNLQDLNFKSTSERAKYYASLKEKYPSGVTKEVFKEKSQTTNRYIIIRNGEVTEIREITFNWGGVQYSKNGKPITVNYFRTLVKPQNGENFSEKIMEN